MFDPFCTTSVILSGVKFFAEATFSFLTLTFSSCNVVIYSSIKTTFFCSRSHFLSHSSHLFSLWENKKSSSYWKSAAIILPHSRVANRSSNFAANFLFDFDTSTYHWLLLLSRHVFCHIFSRNIWSDFWMSYHSPTRVNCSSCSTFSEDSMSKPFALTNFWNRTRW